MKWRHSKADKHSGGIMIRIVKWFTVLVILPFFLLSAVISYNFLNYSVSQTAEQKLSAMDLAGSRIKQIIKAYEATSMTVYYDGIVDRLSEERSLEAADKENISKLLDSICFTTEGIRGAYILYQNDVMYGGKSYQTVTTLVDSNLHTIEAAKGRPVWFASNQVLGNEKQNRFIMARVLRNNLKQNIAVFYLLIDGDRIDETLKFSSSEESTDYLMDNEGRILASSDPAMLNQIQEDIKLDSVHLKQNRKVKLGGSAFRLVDCFVPSVKWHCVSLISVSAVKSAVMKLEAPFLVIAFLYIDFMIVMLSIIRKHVFRPLSEINRAMDEYARDNVRPVSVQISGEGELRHLADHFGNMTVRIDELVHAIKNEEKEKNRQKIKTMTAQLTPHFIYNALNTIKWMAVLNHQDNIQHLTESLIYIFMNAARIEDEKYSLENELELVSHYAVIQKARFMNFDLVIEADETVRRMHIRKLILQPIVENAIVHGLGRGKIKNAKIIVRAWLDGDLYMEVMDSGVGFDVEKWRSCPTEDNTHTNIGLHNVEEMLKLEYGDGYGLTIHSEIGTGTTVEYHLPAIPIER